MTFSADTVCLPDVNVWIAAASDRHEHHAAARQWFDSASAPVCFCRLTQMAFLRLLTNLKVMGEDILSPAEAIAVYRQLFSDERVRFDCRTCECRERLGFPDEYRRRKRRRMDRRIPGRIRHGSKFSFDQLRSRYATVAGAGVGTTDPSLAASGYVGPYSE